MFFDERIEQSRGEISKNCVWFSMMIALVIGGIRLTNVMMNTDGLEFLLLVSLEFVIVLSGGTCFLLGTMMHLGKERDERYIALKGQFYKKAAMVHLKIVLISYAVLNPIVMQIHSPYNYANTPFDHIFNVLFFVIGTYCVYAFKKREIYFNYTIIEETHYYRAVFRNFLKLGKYTLYLLLISLTTLCIHFVRPLSENYNEVIFLRDMLTIVCVYLVGFLVLSLVYLLYSHLEKVSYDSEALVSKSTLISLVVTIVFYLIFTGIAFTVDKMQITYMQKAQIVTMASSLTYVISLAFMMFLTYFGYEYQKKKRNRLLKGAIDMILLCRTVSFLLSAVISNGIYLLIMGALENTDLRLLFSDTNMYAEIAAMCVDVILFSLIIIALVRDKTIHRVHIAAAVIIVILWGVELFLRTQIDILQVNLYHSVCAVAALGYFCILMWRVGKKHTA